MRFVVTAGRFLRLVVGFSLVVGGRLPIDCGEGGLIFFELSRRSQG